MRTTRVIDELTVADIDVARAFYADFLGLSVEAFNLGWVARFETLEGRASIQLVTRVNLRPLVPQTA